MYGKHRNRAGNLVKHVTFGVERLDGGFGFLWGWRHSGGEGAAFDPAPAMIIPGLVLGDCINIISLRSPVVRP